MSTITFLFKGGEVPIKCTQREILVTIIQRFCENVQVSRNQVNFLFNGSILDEQITEDRIPMNDQNKKLIMVDYNDDEEDQADVIVKSKEVICPKCKEYASISMNDDYKISISNCKKGHKTENLLISEFEKTQDINLSKIICDKCKNKNIGKIFNNEFYICINCKSNLCPMCKKEHNLNHNIIKYQNKPYICEEHGEAFISYCNQCKKNLCFTCEDNHNGHDITDFKKLRKNKNELENELNKFKEFIDKIKSLVDDDIKNYVEKSNKVIKNYEMIYQIKKDILSNVEQNLRNLQKLLNQDFIMKKYEDDLFAIIKADNMNNRYLNISKIYERMEFNNLVDLPDIIEFSNSNDKKKEKVFNNIIYYDETYKSEKKEDKEIKELEEITSGSFILCSDINSLDLLKREIINQYQNEKKRIQFNLIIKSIINDNIIAYLNSDNDIKNIIHKICLFNEYLEIWPNLRNLGIIIIETFKEKSDIINFIKTNPIRILFPKYKLITYNNYDNEYIYKYLHKIISYYYGDLSKETYEYHLDKMKALIDYEDSTKQLKKPKEDLLKGFMTFEIRNDSDLMDELIIKEYTKDSIYGDLIKWLMNPKMDWLDTIAYFTSRLMYSLNHYGEKNKMFFDKDKTTLYRGSRLPYSSLLPYIKNVGQIILFQSFTSTNEIEKVAKMFSGRDKSIQQFRANSLFSVIYIITINHHENWISNGINIQNVSCFRNEREILLQPFSFFLLKDIKINITNYTADIYLETIGKKEILEEAIKKGKKIIYNKNENIMEAID